MGVFGSILSGILGVIMNKYFIIIYLTASFVLTYIGLNALKPLRQKTKEDVERDKKYHAFCRWDIDRINVMQCYMFTPLILAKWIFGWNIYAVIWLTIKFLLNFKPVDKPFTGKMLELIRIVISIGGWISMRILGVTSCEVINKEVDYTEYLGPDYKSSLKTLKNPGCVVSNH